jgi:hypothetical protein
MDSGSFVFENDEVRVSLSGSWEIGELALKESFEGRLSLKTAAEMGTILQGIAGSLAFLLPD